MSQKNGGVNFLIHDASGQPQVIKVVQSTPTKQPGTSVNSTPVKTMFKVPGTPESSQGSTMYRTVKVTGIKSGSKIVSVPIQTLSHLQKSMTESQGQSSAGQQKHEYPRSGQSVQSNIKVLQPVASVSSGSSRQVSMSSSVPSNSKRHIAPLPMTRKRDLDEPIPEYTSKRRKAADKVGKGLRHFSLKVCDKVRTKGFTSYNEVADELVAEFAAGMHGSPDTQQYDQKNIRRRVYDALNVLMAMKIISKEKKEIRWIGLPTNTLQEYTSLEKDRDIKTERIQMKTQQLQDLLLQQISFKGLVERNRAAEKRGVKPTLTSAIHMPFIVIQTSNTALIDCSISTDKAEYMFNLDEKFQIYDDIHILKRMGLLLGVDKGECTEENLKIAKNMVPKSLSHYVDRLGRGEPIKMLDMVRTGLTDDEDGDEESDEEEEEEGEGGGGGDEDSSTDDTSSDVDVN